MKNTTSHKTIVLQPSFEVEALEAADVGGAEYTVVGFEFVVTKGLKSAPTGPLDELLCAEVTL
jgi:hypothetical protein